jgi:Tol biopolymer transport system component
VDWQWAWVSRAGQQLNAVGPPGLYRGGEASPDGKRVAVHRHDAAGGDIWVLEPNGAVTRLTFDATHHNSTPIWSPDGTRIVYSALKNGKWGLYQTLSDGSGTAELLVESDQPKVPMSWSSDSKRIVYMMQDQKASGDLWVLPLDGDKKPAPLVATPFNETHAQISPDGKWIAYTSNSTGRNEIHVQPFPSGSGHWQVSTAGGDWPRWRRDGKELFFHDVTTVVAPGVLFGPILSAQTSASGATFQASSPQDVLQTLATTIPHGGADYQTYDVSADGQRFLVMELVPPQLTGGDAGSGGPEPANGLTVVRNWWK